ncbi:MAG: hypothetical protein SP4CHLAM5_04870 [Chlamydiia bacterium]|nr:hypothetical protein [Chlamydiia bacterium]MCH9618358.1 hypothetical protein [Chlamydiia bacterium]
MKKTLLTLLSFAGSAFASGLPVNTPQEPAPTKKENIGHWIVTLGAQSQSEDAKNPNIQLTFGYQSAAEEYKFFQSQKLEFGGGVSLDADNGFFYFPKFTGIHYLNFDSNTRYYFNLGGALAARYFKKHTSKTHNGITYHSYRKTEGGLFLMGSAGVGIEIGQFSGTINSFELSIDQPALYYGKGARPTYCYYPTAKLSYTVGF